jgi:hypothetical protein
VTPTEERAVAAGAVRRAYLAGLNAATAERAEELREPLAEHVRGLVPLVRDLVPFMDPYRRRQSEHCLTRAAETLEGAQEARGAVAYTYDLAVSARALLALYRRPRPHAEDDTTPVGACLGTAHRRG